MKTKTTVLFSILLYTLMLLTACNSKPKVIVEENENPSTTVAGGPAVMGEMADAKATGVHKVVVDDFLQAEKYTYMHVIENTDTFWIASTKREVKKGETVFYKGGLKKTNFESTEFKRTFETLYLVASVVSASEHPGGAMEGASTGMQSNTGNVNQTPIKIAGSVSLKDLFTNKQKYGGKTIIVTGKCVKTNNGIMGKNWVHIQDGSKIKDTNLDLVITTNEVIPLESQVAFEGIITLDKDFGAGYKYDIIMEEGSSKN